MNLLGVYLILAVQAIAGVDKIPPKAKELAPEKVKIEGKHVPVGGVTLDVASLKFLQDRIQEHKVLAMDFKQEIQGGLRNRNREVVGRVFFKRPFKFRWILGEEEFLFDGQHLYNYFPRQAFARKHKLEGLRGQELKKVVDLFLNFQALHEQYEVKGFSTRGVYQLHLIPKEQKDIMHVDMVISEKKAGVFFDKLEIVFKRKKHTFFFSKHEVTPIADEMFAPPQKTSIKAF